MAHEQLILDRYQPIGQAGSGGFATVHVAWDTRIQRKVAIKCIELSETDALRAQEQEPDALRGQQPHTNTPLTDTAPAPINDADPAHSSISVLLSPPRMLARIPGLDEARTAAMLQDSHIVTVYDFEIQDSTAYLIMEYVEGTTLSQFLHNFEEHITLDMVACVFSAISHALEVAHNHQVLHLDIKPDNVLIDQQGNVKVTDFGLALLLDAQGTAVAGGGTIGYMPLEQMCQQTLDERTDEWALASLTYEMLTGENPFLAPDLKRAKIAIEEAELVIPSLCWDEIDPAIDDVMFYALDPDPDERYNTIADFADELMCYLGNEDAGKQQMKALINNEDTEAENGTAGEGDAHKNAREQSRHPRIPLVDRIGQKGGALIARVISVSSGTLLGALALLNTPQLESATSTNTAIFWGILILMGVFAAIRPHIGALLGFVALGISLCLNEAYVVGIVLICAVALWWWFAGRKSMCSSLVALSQPLCGAVGFAPLAPALAGTLIPSVLEATLTTLFIGIAAVVFASLGSTSIFSWDALSNWDFSNVHTAGGNAIVLEGTREVSRTAGAQIQERFFGLLTHVSTWSVIGSWLCAGGIICVCGLRGTKLFDVVGSLLGATCLIFGACFASWLEQGSWMPEPLVLAGVIVAGAFCVLLAVLNVTDRARR